nr:M48 family metalloprotease [Streptomyces sp. HNM0574]
MLADGLDPTATDRENLLAGLDSTEALDACVAAQPASYLGALGTLAVLLVAGLGYWWLPRLREWRGAPVPVGAVDGDGTLRAELDALRERAGVRASVTFRVDPARTDFGACAYGRTGDYTVCLYAGLLARRRTDPARFRSVVLHELAHVRHRDVDHAYAATALWRVFVLLALVPNLTGWTALLLLRSDSPWAESSSNLSRVLFGLLLAALVHLARADLLRQRELHADVQAVKWGADPASWQLAGDDGAGGGLRALPRRAAAQLRTHPGWEERRRVLAEPERLFRVGTRAMFLTGASASLLYGAASEFGSAVRLPAQAALGVMAVVLAVVLAYAFGLRVLRSVRAPLTATGSAAFAGLGLGAGLLVGEFVSSGRYRVDFLPERPLYLLAFLPVAAVPAMWWSQSLRLALGLPRAWLRRAAAAVCALVTAAALWAGLAWWRGEGEFDALGLGEPAGEEIRRVIPGDWQQYAPDLSAMTAGMPALMPLGNALAPTLVALLMWLVPLALLLLQRPYGGARLRRTLGAGLAGGALACAGLALAAALTHPRQPSVPAERTGPFLFVHAWWMTVTVMAACLLTSALVAARSRRHAMPRALVAAQTTQLCAYAALLLLYATDGCLPPLAVVSEVCAVNPLFGLRAVDQILSLTLGKAVVGAACAALLGAGLGRAVRRLRRGGRGRVRRRVSATRLPGRGVRVAVLLVLGVPGLVVTGAGIAGHSAASAGASAPSARPEPTPGGGGGSRELQLAGWLKSGGLRVAERIEAAVDELSAESARAAEQPPKANGKVSLDTDVFHRLCGTLRARTEEARAYFPVPDPALRASWASALGSTLHGAEQCRRMLKPPEDGPRLTQRQREQRFSRALGEIHAGTDRLSRTLSAITERAGYRH